MSKNNFLLGLKYSFKDENNIYMVSWFCRGGDLYYHLENEKVFNENRCKFYAG